MLVLPRSEFYKLPLLLLPSSPPRSEGIGRFACPPGAASVRCVRPPCGWRTRGDAGKSARPSIAGSCPFGEPGTSWRPGRMTPSGLGCPPVYGWRKPYRHCSGVTCSVLLVNHMCVRLSLECLGTPECALASRFPNLWCLVLPCLHVPETRNGLADILRPTCPV